MYRESLKSSTAVPAPASGPVRRGDCRDMVALEQDPSFRGPVCRMIRNHDERAIVAAFAQVAVELGCEDRLREIFQDYNRLDPAVIRALGADRYPTILREVR